MPIYAYKAKSGPQEIKTGTIEADNPAIAAAKLQDEGLFPVSIQESNVPEKSGIFRRQKVKPNDIGVFTRQLHNLLASGLTILSALQILQKQTEKPAMRQVVAQLVDELKGGAHFSEALSKHPKFFSKLYCSIVQAGEAGGFIDAALDRLAEFMEKDESVRRSVIASLTYPILIAVVGTMTIFVLLTFVIPKLVAMFDEFGQALPLPTAALISVSSFLRNYYWLLAVVMALVFFMLKKSYATAEGKLALDRFKLKMPFFGKLNTKVGISNFTRTLAALVGGGVPILTSLDIVGNAMGNEVLKQEVEGFLAKIREGGKLSSCISSSHYFPAYVSNIISIGEESGSLDNALLRVAQTYDREVDQVTKALLSALEPAMIVIMGAIVGFIVIAMLLPIFQINFMAQ